MFLALPNRATLSIADLYNVDDTLFDGLRLPSGFDTQENRALLINAILMRGKDFEVLYPDAVFMKAQIPSWCSANMFVWNRVYQLSIMEYNPIENYDRYEESGETGANSATRAGQSEVNRNASIDGSRNLQNTEVGTQNRSENASESSEETQTTKKAGYNTTTLDTQSGSTNEAESSRAGTVKGTDTKTGNETETDTQNTTSTDTGSSTDVEHSLHEVNRESHIHGNIGVTTVAQMMSGEIGIIPELNLIHRISEDFVQAFCILVY